MDLVGAVFRAAPDCILVVDASGRISMASPQCERVFGFPAESLRGKDVDELVPACVRGPHRAHREGYFARPRTRLMGETMRVKGVREDGSEVPVEVALSHCMVEGIPHAIAIVRDVSKQVRESERLRYLSTHDALTDLHNRAFFEERRAELERGRRSPLSVIMIDVDGLKQINDQHGHEAGDRHLKRLAAVLRGSFRVEDVVARLGGDEFCVLLPQTDRERRDEVVARFREDLERHNEVFRGRPLEVSIGAATARRAAALGRAMRVADERMYAVKRKNKAR